MKLRTRHLIGWAIATLALSSAVNADTTDSRPRTFKQPNGSEFTVVHRGDERGTWFETADGYTIDQAPDGFWYYLRTAQSGEVKRTRRMAHLSLSEEFNVDLHINPHIRDLIPPWFYSGEFDEGSLRKGPHEGKVLIISVEFPDQGGTYHESVWGARIQASDPEAKTIAHYYDAASYGAAELTPAEETYGLDDNGVIGPLLLSMNHPDTGGASVLVTHPEHDLIFQEAVDAADPFIDYASFDTDGDNIIRPDELAIIIVVAGYENARSLGTPSVHAHASIFGNQIVAIDDPAPDGTTVILTQKYAMLGELSDDVPNPGNSIPTTLGTFVHELGHLIYGLPDLYDVDGAVNGWSAGIGSYGLMGTGSRGVDYDNDLHGGETPVVLSAWSQFKLDWANPRSNLWWDTTLTTAGRSGAATMPAEVGIAHMGTVDPFTSVVQCDDKEYFLMQYRTAEGYDRGLPAVKDPATGDEFAGVVIYHVDERQSNNNTALLKMVDVEEASAQSVDTVLANHFQLWNEDNQTEFDTSSTPSSSFHVGGDSGVSVSVGGPTVDSEGENAVILRVNSLCDLSGVVPSFP